MQLHLDQPACIIESCTRINKITNIRRVRQKQALVQTADARALNACMGRLYNSASCSCGQSAPGKCTVGIQCSLDALEDSSVLCSDRRNWERAFQGGPNIPRHHSRFYRTLCTFFICMFYMHVFMITDVYSVNSIVSLFAIPCTYIV